MVAISLIKQVRRSKKMDNQKKQRLLEARKKAKKKKPDFVIKDTHKKVRVPCRWRKPRGKHSPVRQRHRGRPKLVSIGYGSPKEVRNLDLSGLERVMVNSLSQLEELDPKRQGIIISGKTGKKKKAEIIKIALERNISILNLKDAQGYLDKVQAELKERKESRKKKLSEKEKKEEEKKKKAAEKEKKKKEEAEKKETAGEKEGGEESTKEKEQKEKKEEQKKEIEKTLIKKQ
jgi:large subunit ribosomal protein L32e